MPIPRVMGDMLLLPTGDIIIINGAELGVAGFDNGRVPITRPIIYRPSEDRFFIMSPSSKPRMYHSTAILLPDGRLLIGGSNAHIYYNFTNVDFPTDLSLEAYSPPYLSTTYRLFRPVILKVDEVLTHGGLFYLSFFVKQYLTSDVLMVQIFAPPFVTHSFSMKQRMIVLKIIKITHDNRGGRRDWFNVTAVGPSSAEIAPPGYYLIFVVHASVPSSGAWVKIE
ncbi:aldehyde oxidase GLOX-like [Carica papaya]|uniref:aldehyde oxidase GLOX-like n=1 Tax=Carica papaya TaxID=3649 RepID=UPI000B8CA7A2|nr:aldehyde oxidase GLOX-like [Carica papaya]